jgi:serine/threonine-protein kinase SRPK3
VTLIDPNPVDLRPENVLFRLTDQFKTLTDNQLYTILGKPQLEPVCRADGREPGYGVPREVVSAIDPPIFYKAGLMLQDVIIADFGSSFRADTIPSGDQATTDVDFRAPEILMGETGTQAIDIWSLGCFFLDVRAITSLFCPALPGGSDQSLKKIVHRIGRLPEPWWSSWVNRPYYFDDMGNPIEPYDGGPSSIRSALENVGSARRDVSGPQYAHPIFERRGTRMAEAEIDLLDDLLCKMLKHRPEDRITIEEVVRHPWFQFQR